MLRQTNDRTGPGGLDPDPSTRRAPSGSPVSPPPRPTGGPDFSVPSEAVFAAIKARIGQLWEIPDDLDAKRAFLTGVRED